MSKTSDKHTGYIATGTDNAFQARSKAVFDSLEVLEAKHLSSTIRDDNSEEQSLCKNDPENDEFPPISRNFCKRSYPDFNSKTSEVESPPFKRPMKINQKAADYRKNPSKWMHYDLSDVSPDQISNSSNTAAAFEFMQSRKKISERSSTLLDERDCSNSLEAESNSKHIFRIKKKLDVMDTCVGNEISDPPSLSSEKPQQKIEIKYSHIDKEDYDENDTAKQSNISFANKFKKRINKSNREYKKEMTINDNEEESEFFSENVNEKKNYMAQNNEAEETDNSITIINNSINDAVTDEAETDRPDVEYYLE